MARSWKRQNSTKLTINLSACKYQVLRIVGERLGFEIVDSAEEQEWDVYWSDLSVSTDRVSRLLPYQILNHFPGMLEICRKAQLCQHLQRIAKKLPKDYQFAPQSYALPEQLTEFVCALRKNKDKVDRCDLDTWIVKPSAGAMGRGILLVQHESQLVQADLSIDINRAVAQLYIPHPLLLDGFKFDMRIYVLVTCVDPMQVYLYDEGIARLATEQYCQPSSKNLATKNMHLTNYAINKNCSNFVEGDGLEKGSKRLLSAVLEALERRGLDRQMIWKNIADLIVKTLLPIQPHLAHTYYTARAKHASWTSDASSECPMESQCFELLGFDVMLDADAQPWLLEVNHSPSFGIETVLDLQLKSTLLMDTMKLLSLNSFRRRQYFSEQHTAQQQRLYLNRFARSCKPIDPAPSMGKPASKRAVTLSSDDDPTPPQADPERFQGRYEGLAAAPRSCGAFQLIFPEKRDEGEARRYQKIQECASRLYPEQRCSCLYCAKRKKLRDISYAIEVMTDSNGNTPAAAHAKGVLSSQGARLQRPSSAMPGLGSVGRGASSREKMGRPSSAPISRPGGQRDAPVPLNGGLQRLGPPQVRSVLDTSPPSQAWGVQFPVEGLCRPPAAARPCSGRSPRATAFHERRLEPGPAMSPEQRYKYLTPAMKRLLERETRAAHAISQRYISKATH